MNSIRDKKIKKIIEMQKKLFLPMHVDTYEEIDEKDDHALQLSLRSTEILFTEQSGRTLNDIK